MRTCILILLYLQSVLAGPIKENCGEGYWFHGFTGNSGFHFTTMDIQPSNYPWIVLGGYVDDATGLNPSMQTGQAAVLAWYDESNWGMQMMQLHQEVTYTHSSGVPTTVSIHGIKAVKFKRFNENQKKVFGVFEAADQTTLLFFKADIEPKMKVTTIPGYEEGYGCSITNHSLVNDALEAATFQACSPAWSSWWQPSSGLDRVYSVFMNLENSAEAMVGMLHGQDSTSIMQHMSFMWAGENTAFGTFVAIEEHGTNKFLHQVTLGVTTTAEWLAAPECFSQLEMTDPAFQSLFAGIDNYTPVNVMERSTEQYATISLHDTTCATNCGVMFITQNVVQANCGQEITIRVMRHTNSSTAWHLKSYTHRYGNDYATIYDPVQGKYWHLYDFDATDIGGIVALQILTYDATNTDPAFDYVSRVNQVEMNLYVGPIAMGDTFTLQEQAFTDTCLSMTTVPDVSVEVSFEQYFSAPAGFTTDRTFDGSFTNGATLQAIPVVFNDELVISPDFTSNTWLQAQIKNPCMFEITTTIADAVYNIGDSPLDLVPSSETVSPACPSGTAGDLETKIVINQITDSNGQAIASLDFAVVSGADLDSITIQVTDINITPPGFYTIQFVSGLLEETDWELLDNQLQAFVVEVTGECGPNLTLPLNIASAYQQPMYNSNGSLDFTGIANGDCQFTAQVLKDDGTGTFYDIDNASDVIFNFTPVVLNEEVPLGLRYYSVVAVPILTWDSTTSAPATEGIYTLKLVMTSILSGTSQEYEFTVDIFDNPCDGTWSGLPAQGFDTTHTIHQAAPAYVEFLGFDYSMCTFSVSIYSDAQQSPAISMFTLNNQPCFSQAPDPPNTFNDPRVVDICSPGSILEINTDGYTNVDAGVYTIYVRVSRTKFTGDPEFTDFTMLVTIEENCDIIWDTPNPDIPHYEFIPNSSATLTLQFDTLKIDACPYPQSPTVFQALDSDGQLINELYEYTVTTTFDSITIEIFTDSQFSKRLDTITVKEIDANGLSGEVQNSFTIQFMDHWCMSAQLELPANYTDYYEHESITEDLMINLQSMIDLFVLDQPHRAGCSVDFNFTFTTENEETIEYTESESWITIQTQTLMQSTVFGCILTGFIDGPDNFPSLPLNFTVLVIVPEEEENNFVGVVVQEIEESNTTTELNQTQQGNSTSNSSSLQEQQDYSFQFVYDWFHNYPQSNYSQKPIIASIEDISTTGALTIKFNYDMLTPSDIEELAELLIHFRIDQIVGLTVLSDYYEPESEKPTISNYTLISYEERTLKIQVNFLHPNYISINNLDKDRLRVQFTEYWFFITSETGQRLEDNTIIYATIEKQLTEDQNKELQAFAIQVEDTFKATGKVIFVISLLLSYALKHLWDMVNVIQFLVFMGSWNIGFPHNGQLFLSKIKFFALMEWLPYKDVTEWISVQLGLDDSCEDQDCESIEETPGRLLQSTDGSNSSTDQKQKFGTSNLAKNIGVIFVIALGIILFLLIFYLAKCLAHQKYAWYRIYIKLHEKIHYNLFIRFIIQSNLKLQMATSTTCMLINWKTTSNLAQGIVSTVFLIAFQLIPIVFGLVMKANYNDLDKYKMKKRIGSMYSEIWLDKLSIYSLAYSIVFLLRRSVFVVITFVQLDYPGIQIQSLIFSSMLYITYLNGSRIYKQNFVYMIENTNEVLLLITCYHIVLFGNLLHDPILIEQIGISMIASVCLILTIGTVNIIIINFRAMKHTLKLRKFDKQRKAILAKREHKLKEIIEDKSTDANSKEIISKQRRMSRLVIEESNREITMIGKSEKQKRAMIEKSEKQKRTMIETYEKQNRIIEQEEWPSYQSFQESVVKSQTSNLQQQALHLVESLESSSSLLNSVSSCAEGNMEDQDQQIDRFFDQFQLPYNLKKNEVCELVSKVAPQSVLLSADISTQEIPMVPFDSQHSTQMNNKLLIQNRTPWSYLDINNDIRNPIPIQERPLPIATIERPVKEWEKYENLLIANDIEQKIQVYYRK